MSRSVDDTNELVPLGSMKCPVCGSAMKKVSWKITAAAFDAGKEAEQTVFQCESDKNFISIEVSTGKNSEFAMSDYPPEY